MHFGKRNFLIVFFLLLTTFIFCSCGSEQSEETNTEKDTVVTIGTMNLVNGDLISQYEKWYENELGAKVKVIKFDSGKDINAALASNSIDIGQAGTSPAALAISNGLDIDVIWVGDVIGAAETLVARKDSGVNSVKDLVGKKVGTPFSSTAHYSLLNALKLAGVDENSVTILDLQPDDIFAAWQRGDIDAAYVWYPVLSRLMENGIAITDSKQLAQQGVVTADLVVVRRPFAEKHADIVKRFIALQIKSNDMINNDRTKAAKEVAAVLEISEDDASEQLSQFEYLTPEEQLHYLNDSLANTLKDTADFLVEQKSIKSAPDLKTFKSRVTAQFMQDVDR